MVTYSGLSPNGDFKKKPTREMGTVASATVKVAVEVLSLTHPQYDQEGLRELVCEIDIPDTVLEPQ